VGKWDLDYCAWELKDAIMGMAKPIYNNKVGLEV
jgi:hypothetical protein